MEVPETVRTAIDDRPVEGAVCLEAGAGAGNMSAALLDAGAKEVYAVTNDPDHAGDVRERFAGEDRLTVLEGDLRETPLPTTASTSSRHTRCSAWWFPRRQPRSSRT